MSQHKKNVQKTINSTKDLIKYAQGNWNFKEIVDKETNQSNILIDLNVYSVTTNIRIFDVGVKYECSFSQARDSIFLAYDDSRKRCYGNIFFTGSYWTNTSGPNLI